MVNFGLFYSIFSNTVALNIIYKDTAYLVKFGLGPAEKA